MMLRCEAHNDRAWVSTASGFLQYVVSWRPRMDSTIGQVHEIHFLEVVGRQVAGLRGEHIYITVERYGPEGAKVCDRAWVLQTAMREVDCLDVVRDTKTERRVGLICEE